MVSMADMERMHEWGMPDRRTLTEAKSTQGYFRVQPKQVPTDSRPTAERLSKFLRVNANSDIDQNGTIEDRHFPSIQDSDPSPEAVATHRRFLLSQQTTDN